MIRCDNIDIATQQFGPEMALLLSVADRWRTLGNCPEAFHVLIREEQIMWTGFDGNVCAPCSRFCCQCDTAARADVDDVQLRAGLASQQRRALDRFQFRDHWTRLEEISNTLPPVLRHPARQGVDQFVILRVYRDRYPQVRRLAETFPHRQVI